jgi:hypothetical protein
MESKIISGLCDIIIIDKDSMSSLDFVTFCHRIRMKRILTKALVILKKVQNQNTDESFGF